LQNSRWSLTDEEIEGYVVRSFDYIIDYLNRRGESVAASLDPIGDENLALSKKIRRMARREVTTDEPNTLRALAEDFFPLPEIRWNHWYRDGVPLRPATEVFLPQPVGNGTHP